MTDKLTYAERVLPGLPDGWWLHPPTSQTDTGLAYQPDEETRTRYEKAVAEYALRDYTGGTDE